MNMAAAFLEHLFILSECQALIVPDVTQEVPAYELDRLGRSGDITDEIEEVIPSSGDPRVRNGAECDHPSPQVSAGVRPQETVKFPEKGRRKIGIGVEEDHPVARLGDKICTQIPCV